MSQVANSKQLVDASLTVASAVTSTGPITGTKKPTPPNTLTEFGGVGLLDNEPPDTTGLPFS